MPFPGGAEFAAGPDQDTSLGEAGGHLVGGKGCVDPGEGLTSEAFLIRLTRRTHFIQDFKMPGISPMLFCRDLPALPIGHQAHSNTRKVPGGTLTLSSEGLTITTCETLTHDLVIGHVPSTCLAPETASSASGTAYGSAVPRPKRGKSKFAMRRSIASAAPCGRSPLRITTGMN